MDLRSTATARGLLALGVLALTACAGSAPPEGAAPAGSPVASVEPAAAAPAGVAYFTAEQADRGQRVFGSVCGVCHGAGEFRGPIFQLSWMDRPVGDLFQHVSTMMPQDNPGSLQPEEYASVLAHILRLNGLAPGDRELPADPAQLRSLTWGR